MAHILRITDGTTTINFVSGDNIELMKYDPLVSEDGSQITESAEIKFTSTATANATKLRGRRRPWCRPPLCAGVGCFA